MARWQSASAAASAASAGFGGVGQPQPHLHHALHLLLAGAAPQPATASLTWLGVYCTTSQPAAAASARARPLAWPDAHGRAHVDLEEHVLDGHHVRPQLGDERGQLTAELGQALRQRIGGRGA